MTTPCDSQFSLLFTFISRRLYQSSESSVSCNQMLWDYAIREINFLLWLSFVGISAILLRKLFVLFKIWSYGSRIPGPPSPSFYGHSVLFAGANSHQDLTDLLDKSHKKYGSIIKLWLSPTQLLVSVKDPLVINELLLKAADKMPLIGRVYRLAFGQSSFFVSSFEKVKRRRETLAVELNGKLLEKANAMTDRAVDFVMERICVTMDKGALDCEIFSQHMAFSILGATFFGDAFFAWSKANAYEELLIRIAKDACFWASYNVPPFWKQGYWKYQHLCSKLKSLTQDIVQQCQMNYKLLCQPNCHSNPKMKDEEAASGTTFSSGVAKLASSSSQEPCCHQNQREEANGNVMGMMFHGCLTTAGLIGNVLARLSMHPGIQEKIYLEVTTIRKRYDKLKKQDVSEMHLLLATLYESARLLPAGPLLQRCSLGQDLDLKNGLHIPAGALLVAPIQLVQMDENNWGSDAAQFNPYRFLSKSEKRSELSRSSETTDAAEVPPDSGDGSYILSNPYKNAAFLPFGSGLRGCVGQRFAILGIASIFASLLEQYEVKLVPGSYIEPRPLMTNCVLQLGPSPKIVFVRRDA
ncbi:cytochrome P450 4d2-like [Chenopodium quinoa]|uniref:Cytochrome P450 n=1 Tax=Chenopodium quinoa TaxID=63459 RepID=A0A803MMS0_CHEQI|nr:cytochrome P450 4d2-like [Chenopodium quinoa]